jgi:hypothetical protein
VKRRVSLAQIGEAESSHLLGAGAAVEHDLDHHPQAQVERCPVGLEEAEDRGQRVVIKELGRLQRDLGQFEATQGVAPDQSVPDHSGDDGADVGAICAERLFGVPALAQRHEVSIEVAGGQLSDGWLMASQGAAVADEAIPGSLVVALGPRLGPKRAVALELFEELAQQRPLPSLFLRRNAHPLIHRSSSAGNGRPDALLSLWRPSSKFGEARGSSRAQQKFPNNSSASLGLTLDDYRSHPRLCASYRTRGPRE